MVAANMSFWSVDSDIGNSPDGALGLGPTHEETLPCALAFYNSWALGPLGSLGSGPAHEDVSEGPPFRGRILSVKFKGEDSPVHHFSIMLGGERASPPRDICVSIS